MFSLFAIMLFTESVVVLTIPMESISSGVLRSEDSVQTALEKNIVYTVKVFFVLSLLFILKFCSSYRYPLLKDPELCLSAPVVAFFINIGHLVYLSDDFPTIRPRTLVWLVRREQQRILSRTKPKPGHGPTP